MEYEITIKIKVDPTYFYLGLDLLERQSTMSEIIHNAVHDIDDVKITAIRTEEVDR